MHSKIPVVIRSTTGILVSLYVRHVIHMDN